MPIELAKNYVGLLDEVYQNASLTSDLNSGAETIRQGANAGEFLVAKLKMDGLKNYTRNSGYTSGAVDLSWETIKYNYDRGIKFTVDAMDNEETVGLSFGRLGAEFERTKVAPEADAFCFATLAGTSGITSKTLAKATALKTGKMVLDAIVEAQNTMDEAQVPTESRILYITPTLLRLAKSVENYVNVGVLDEFVKVVPVPQSRFYTKVDLVNDTANGDMKGGFKKNSDGADIHFMIVEKSAVIKHDKHVASDIITPAENQASDGYMQKYRKYGVVDVYENKVSGIYCAYEGA